MPLDTVSSIVWDTQRNSDYMFAASSWDGLVRLYHINNQEEVNRVWQMFLGHPVLCVDFGDNGILYAGLASGDVLAIDLEGKRAMNMGAHEAPICGIYWIREKGCLMTLGFDNLIRMWVPTSNPFLQQEYKLPLKTVVCSFDFPFLLIGSVQTTSCIISLKKLPEINIPNAPENYIKSTLERFSKFSSCRVISQNSTAMLGTIDGRLLSFTFKEDYRGSIDITSPYVIRGQKRTDNRGSSVHGMVNSIDIGYHNYETFSLSAGTEDIVVFNNIKKMKCKSLITSSSNVPAGTAVRISPKNQYIAYAVGSDWTKGLYELENIKKPKIFVVKINNSDLNEFTSK